MKKTIAMLLSLTLMLALLTGCGQKAPAATEAPQPAATEAPAPAETPTAPAEPQATPNMENALPMLSAEEDYSTGDASLDDPRNQDDIGEREILLVSFGTSYNDSRRLTIGAIENAVAAAYPGWSVRRAFTSQTIIDRVAARDGEKIDNVTEALDRALANGVKVLVVQPTHLMNGIEYNELKDTLASYADAFTSLAVGAPLLSSEDDFQRVAAALVSATAEYDDAQTAVVLMGHGTEAESNGVYATMQETLKSIGAEKIFVGTVEATPTLDDVMRMLHTGPYHRIILRPLMIVAGDHANNDMAGDGPDSWKSVLFSVGYEPVPVLEGLGQLEAVQELFVLHVGAAMSDAGIAA